ncbi:hypothetical protein ACFE04_024727 [Oxalis oulophora]
MSPFIAELLLQSNNLMSAAVATTKEASATASRVVAYVMPFSISARPSRLLRCCYSFSTAAFIVASRLDIKEARVTIADAAYTSTSIARLDLVVARVCEAVAKAAAAVSNASAVRANAALKIDPILAKPLLQMDMKEVYE